MILITGGSGFIGSAYVWHLNQQNFDKIIICDTLGKEKKWLNLRSLKFKDIIFPKNFLENKFIHKEIKQIVHLGATTTTTEQNMDFLIENNFYFSKSLWNIATNLQIPFIYASSGATYGDGKLGYDDKENKISSSLVPLNKYGYSKQLFDLWVLSQKKKPSYYVGMKFFNVFGPNEYHKQAMASVIYQIFKQTKEKGYVTLFKSHHPKIKNGEQKRDFVYVKDVCKIIDGFCKKLIPSGLYNVGSGKANSFLNLVNYTFEALKLKPKIKYIDTPKEIRNQYQYYTKANMEKTKKILSWHEPNSFKNNIKDYITNYLTQNNPYLK